MAAPRAPRGHRARQVVEPTETALEKARQLKKADEQSKLYHQHLIFVKDQVERIAYDNGGSLGSGGGGARRASPAAATANGPAMTPLQPVGSNPSRMYHLP